jgi:hypothetical protein
MLLTTEARVRVDGTIPPTTFATNIPVLNTSIEGMNPVLLTMAKIIKEVMIAQRIAPIGTTGFDTFGT